MGAFDFAGDLASAGVAAWQGSENRESQERIARENMAMQVDFAKHGLGYRVEDAVAHGLHPLIGAGAQPASYSPVSIGNVDYGSMGQDIGRAIKSLGTSEERKEKDAEDMVKLQKEKGALENDLLKTELVSKVARATQGGQLAPPIPMPRPGPSRSPTGIAVKDDDLKQKEDLVPETKNIPFLGMNLKPWSKSADAQNLENRYGEWGGDVMGLFNIPADMANTIGQTQAWQMWERLMRKNWFNELRGGDRSRWSRGQRNMRGGG